MRLLRRIPCTLVFLVIMVVANGLAGTFLGVLPSTALSALGISLRTIMDGEVYRLLTATFLSHDFAMFLRQMAFAALIIGYYELRQGTARALAMFVLIDIVGTLIVLFMVISPITYLGADLAVLHDVGMSAGGFGLIGAIFRFSPWPWMLMSLTIAAIGAKMMLNFEIIADSAHLICLVLGFALQWLWPTSKRVDRNLDRR